MNLTLLAVVNLAGASLSFVNATSIALFSSRPRLRRLAGAVAALSAVYVAIFVYRLSNFGVRNPDWIGELGSIAAPMAFVLVWVWPLRVMDDYVRREDDAVRKSNVAIGNVK